MKSSTTTPLWFSAFTAGVTLQKGSAWGLALLFCSFALLLVSAVQGAQVSWKWLKWTFGF